PLAIPLPSTASLASGSASFGGFVRTYGAVRLPVSVHHRRASLDFRLPAAVWGFLFPRQTQELSVPAQGAYEYARVSDRGAHKRLAISTLPVFPSAYFDSVVTPE